MTLFKQGCLCIITICLLLQGCESFTEKDNVIQTVLKDDGLTQFEGEVVYLSFAGGFWGIVTIDGKKYDSVTGVPDEFATNGLKVKGKCRIIKGGASFHMWGELAEIIEIELK